MSLALLQISGYWSCAHFDRVHLVVPNVEDFVSYEESEVCRMYGRACLREQKKLAILNYHLAMGYKLVSSAIGCLPCRLKQGEIIEQTEFYLEIPICKT